MKGQECFEQQYANYEADLGTVHKIQRIAVVAPLGAYYLFSRISEDHDVPIYKENGQKQVIYSSTSSSNVEWLHLNLLTRSLRIIPVFDKPSDEASPLILITACKYSSHPIYFDAQPYTVDSFKAASHPIYFDAQPYTVDSFKAGLVSMYENELIVTFRTFENGVFFFSVADQGDMLIAQIIGGVIETIFDFGSLSRTSLTAGKALNDGEWHEMKWSHQFDSVQLFIDGILMNQTTPSGLYRKLDFNFQIEIGGRPEDQYSADIETSYHGCLARMQLNNIDLLTFAPPSYRECQMPRPQLLTIQSGAVQIPYSFLPFAFEFRVLPQLLTIQSGAVQIPYSFLPFAFEFRVLPLPSSLLTIFDTNNNTLIEVIIDANQTLTLETEKQQIKQLSLPIIQITDGNWHAMSVKLRGGRLDVDVDGLTVLWLEGNVVRKIGLRMAFFRLSSPGCYRSATVDLKSATIISGKAIKGRCMFIEKCLPNPCENGGKCLQTGLEEFKCICQDYYGGRYCHTSLLPRSCEDFRATEKTRPRHHPFVRHFLKKSSNDKVQNITIDLDGGGPLKPFKVKCTTAVNEKDLKLLDDSDDWTILEHFSIDPEENYVRDQEVN
uniref:Uncharacterized protein n=1 Tax=Panagrolaimus sp. PS1159 TaxID=55785 RepID=A0AC35FHP7_9BILA